MLFLGVAASRIILHSSGAASKILAAFVFGDPAVGNRDL
jgi:hypothetical protein